MMVRDTSGATYSLTASRMVETEDCVGACYGLYSLQRTDLREILAQRPQQGAIGSFLGDTRLHGTWYVRARKGSLNIGCKMFVGGEARKLKVWALRRRAA